MTKPVYLDNHSTTQVDPRVVQAMLPYFTQHFGNAASKQHLFGWNAEAAVEKARHDVASLINASSEEIVFTSGATESINLTIKGVADEYRSRGNHIITVATEHSAVLDSVRKLERQGFDITILPVDNRGMVDSQTVKAAIRTDTILVSVMMANNEIGTIAPLKEIAACCKAQDVLFHTDATQAVGRIPVDVCILGVDLLSFSAHKMYGPKGVGALFVRLSKPSIRLATQLDGGGHERGLRSGTLNVPGIVGFGKACDLAGMEMKEEAIRVASLRNQLRDGLSDRVGDVWFNGHPEQTLPGNLNVIFSGVRADKLMMCVKDIAVSTGSACSSGSPEPSHVLLAIGVEKQDAGSSIRFGVGRFTTSEEIEYTIEQFGEAVRLERERTLNSYHYQPGKTLHETN